MVAALCLASACAGVPPRTRSSRTALARSIERSARAYLPGGGSRRTPADCSDFVQKVFRESDVALPRTSRAMSAVGRPVKTPADLRTADLVFFSNDDTGPGVGHVGIYLENGVFIHKSKSTGSIRTERLDSDYFRQRYLKARRVID